MRSQITYKLVIPNTLEFTQLQEFAKSFEHEIHAHPNIAVYAHYRDGVLFGYSDHVYIPVIYPAFHPELTRPKDVIQVTSDWIAHMQFQGGFGYIGVPTEEKRTNFTDKIMEKLGLKRCFRELFTINN
jgi:hypothetical protein